jgi:hypothetical protein
MFEIELVNQSATVTIDVELRQMVVSSVFFCVSNVPRTILIVNVTLLISNIHHPKAEMSKHKSISSSSSNNNTRVLRSRRTSKRSKATVDYGRDETAWLDKDAVVEPSASVVVAVRPEKRPTAYVKPIARRSWIDCIAKPKCATLVARVSSVNVDEYCLVNPLKCKSVSLKMLHNQITTIESVITSITTLLGYDWRYRLMFRLSPSNITELDEMVTYDVLHYTTRRERRVRNAKADADSTMDRLTTMCDDTMKLMLSFISPRVPMSLVSRLTVFKQWVPYIMTPVLGKLSRKFHETTSSMDVPVLIEAYRYSPSFWWPTLRTHKRMWDVSVHIHNQQPLCVFRNDLTMTCSLAMLINTRRA